MSNQFNLYHLLSTTIDTPKKFRYSLYLCLQAICKDLVKKRAAGKHNNRKHKHMEG
jgi:hypothetical protein